MTTYSLEEGDGVLSPPCECCGNSTRTIWGFVYKNDDAHAIYYVRWTLSHLDQGARFDVVIGEWGDGSTAADRFAVQLNCDLLDTNFSFMVVDAEPDRTSTIASRHLLREEVIGTSLAAEIFEIIDHIWIHDPRIDELRNAP